MLLDIATEVLSHLEVIGSIVAMLNKGVKSALSEAALEEADMYMAINAGGDSHTQSLLYGDGPSLPNSSGVPWTAAYIDSRGDPTCDLRSNIAAESRAKIIYERLINITDDPGIKDALGFLTTREIAHQKSFEKALISFARISPRTSRLLRRCSSACGQTPALTLPRAWSLVQDREQVASRRAIWAALPTCPKPARWRRTRLPQNRDRSSRMKLHGWALFAISARDFPLRATNGA